MPTKASVTSWTGVRNSVSSVEPRMATAPRSISSFRTRPSTRNTPVMAGSPSHPTVNGDSALLMGVRTFSVCHAKLTLSQKCEHQENNAHHKGYCRYNAKSSFTF